MTSWSYWTDLLVGWSPMLIVIAVWIHFMSRPHEHFARSQKHLEGVEELLGRIATALERR
jgi:hypothetical protein